MIVPRLAARSRCATARSPPGSRCSPSPSASCCCSAWRRCAPGRARASPTPISGTDLIVGARSGNIQLLLYSVFRIGNATNNVTWKSYEDIAKRPEVAWIVPLSLGDSHHGFRVLGTTPRLLRALQVPPRTRPDVRLRRARSRTCSTPCSAPTSPRRSATRSAIRSSSPTASARYRSSSTPTSRSASPASSPRPARRSTARCTSASRPSRPSTSTGRAACRCRAKRCRPMMRGAWT